MVYDKGKNRCCTQEINIIEIDGTHVCTYCGLVIDTQCYYEERKYAKTNVYTNNAVLNEYCARGEIDTQTQLIAERMYKKWLVKHSTLHKNTLIACAMYVACKKNNSPRTIKEISGISGCDTKQLGRYEHIVSNQHYRTNPSNYVHRFCQRLGMTYKQIKTVEEAISSSQVDDIGCNPAAVTSAYIYKLAPSNIVKLKDIQDVSGISTTSIKRIYRKLFPYIE